MGKNRIRYYINFLIVSLTVLAMCLMVFRADGALTATGLSGLKFFTAQSNIFRAAVSVFILISIFRKPSEKAKRRLAVWSLASTCSVGVTFIVVFCFFGPLYGLPNMLRNANFFFHMVIPVLSIIEFIVFNDVKIERTAVIAAMIHPLLYGIGYYINLTVNGIGVWPDTNDWYGFVNWGFSVGFMIFGVICLVSVLIGLLLRFLNSKVRGE